MFRITVIVPLTTGNTLKRSGEVEHRVQLLTLFDTIGLEISRDLAEMGVDMAPGTTPLIEVEQIISTTYDNPTAFMSGILVDWLV